MNKKLLAVVSGIVLVLGSFFVGMKYKEATNKNSSQNNTVQICLEPGKNTEIQNCSAVNESSANASTDLDSLLTTSKPYSLGETRTILPLKDIEEKITLGNIHEIKTVVDQENHLSYRVYRVGQGDVPPTYSEGRLFLQIVDSSSEPRYVWTKFDTQIDRVEPLGEIRIQKEKLIITCAKTQNIDPAKPCEYTVNYSKENQDLSINRSI
ncbi:MAG: hypothetical protein KBC69_03755 [Candidatus Magasanikbacteria bacterium]|nr:hypothetical protein [Candidatus Magasanikbacteria bacterium]